MGNTEKIESSFKEFMTAYQAARLYGAGHALAKKAVEKAYLSLQDVLAERGELVIGIIGEELAFDKEIFFDLSNFLKPFIIELKNRGIERIAFSRALNSEELNKFVEFLVIPKEELKGDPANYLSLSGVKNISISKVKVSEADSERPTSNVEIPPGLQGMYDVSLNNVSADLTKIMNMEVIEAFTLKLAISNIVNNLGVYYKQMFKLAAVKRYDVGTFTHLLNVSILSMHFSSRLGFNKDVVMDIGLSALFHDIGKLYISRKTIRKPGQLTAQEFAQMESHTVLGAKLLLQYVDAIGVMPVVICYEHHMKHDLSGYPKQTYKNKQHLASAIVSICDVYDALSQRRSYKSDYPPNMIYDIMMRGSGTGFDPDLLNVFFKTIGVWPIGSIVALSDQRIAIVTEENEDSIFLPVVKIVSPKPEGEIINLKESKDGLKIDHYLSPWAEGKEFLNSV